LAIEWIGDGVDWRQHGLATAWVGDDVCGDFMQIIFYLFEKIKDASKNNELCARNVCLQ
jgi:hypothetical protein